MRKLYKILKWSIGIFLVYVVGFLVFGTLTDWRPEGTETLSSSMGSAALAEPAIQDSVISLLSWNVGYGGIGDEDFFFYNKGDFFWTTPGTVRMSEERIKANVAGQELTITNTLSDFFLLQEIDTAAYRSRYINQLQTAREARPTYATFFAPNFKSKRVPLPLLQPWDHYGYVVGGLVSMSKYRPSVAERIQLPGEFPWPTKLFQLDRCALRQVFPVKGGKELAIYNVHLSAYDKDGSIRRQQMNLLRESALADQAAGRYVIIGGDWNQMPPGFNWFSLNPTVEKVALPTSVGFDFMPAGWKYAYDPTTASVRESHMPYDAHRSRRSVIDFFLISPDLKIKRVKGLNQGFRYSDHQPVYLEVEVM